MVAQLERLLGILTFNKAVYQGIANDPKQTDSAGAVILSVYVLNGLVQGYTVAMAQPDTSRAMKMVTVGMSGGYQLFVGLFVWVVGAFLHVVLATTIFRAEVNVGQMMRIIGYASLFRLLGLIPLAPFVESFYGFTLDIKLLGYLLAMVGSGIGLKAISRIGILPAVLVSIIAGALALYLILIIQYIINLLFYTLGLTS